MRLSSRVGHRGDQTGLAPEPSDHRLQAHPGVGRDVLQPDPVVRQGAEAGEQRVDDPIPVSVDGLGPPRHLIASRFHVSQTNTKVEESPMPASPTSAQRDPSGADPTGASPHPVATASGPATVLWPSMFVDGRTFDQSLPLLPGRRLVVVDGPGTRGQCAPEPTEHDRRGRRRSPGAADRSRTRPSWAWTVRWTGSATRSVVTSGTSWPGGPGCSAAWPPSAPRPSRSRRRCGGRSGLLGPLLRLLGPVGPVRDAILTALVTEASAADP